MTSVNNPNSMTESDWFKFFDPEHKFTNQQRHYILYDMTGYPMVEFKKVVTQLRRAIRCYKRDIELCPCCGQSVDHHEPNCTFSKMPLFLNNLGSIYLSVSELHCLINGIPKSDLQTIRIMVSAINFNVARIHADLINDHLFPKFFQKTMLIDMILISQNINTISAIVNDIDIEISKHIKYLLQQQITSAHNRLQYSDIKYKRLICKLPKWKKLHLLF